MKRTVRLRVQVVEFAVLIFGIIAAIAAWADTKKAWLSLTILVMSLGLEAVLELLHETDEKGITK